MNFICRATRININFYSRSCGRVTVAFWKWHNFCKFALSVLSVCSQFLSYLLQLHFSPTRRHFLNKFWLVLAHFSTSRAWKYIYRATKRHPNFWPSSTPLWIPVLQKRSVLNQVDGCSTIVCPNMNWFGRIINRSGWEREGSSLLGDL